MSVRLRLVLAVAVVAAVFAARPAAQQGYDVFQQGLAKERAAGDLDAAIQIYLRIVNDTGADRAVVAKALVQLAGCYEKLGSPEARKSYQRVIDQFKDQPEMVAVAAARLAPAPPAPPITLLKKAAESPARLVDLPDGTLSPDGRHLAIAGAAGGLALRNLGTGQIRQLVVNADAEETCGNFAWSRDSTRLAYNWCYKPGLDGKPYSELRVIGLDGSGARVIRPKSASFVAPLAWSPSGRAIVAILQRSPTANSSQVALLSVEDGTVRALKTGETKTMSWPGANMTAVSPDGRFVMYTPAANDDKGIFVLATDGSGEQLLFGPTNHDVFLGWTPSGRSILFWSGRNGTDDLWTVEVVNGQIGGVPMRVSADLGPVTPLGLTDAGAFYYRAAAQTPSAVTDIYLAPLDPVTSRVLATPTLLPSRVAGHMTYPEWSRDGRELAFKLGIAGRASTGPGIWIRNLATGEDRRLDPHIDGDLGQFAWSRDGSGFIAAYTGGAPRLVKIDAQTGEAAAVIGAKPEQASGPGSGALSQPRWLPDGRTVLFVADTQVRQRRLDTGDERTIADMGQPIYSLAVSPDGATVAFFSPEANGKLMIWVAATADGRPRALLEHREKSRAKQLTWSPDGRYLVFSDRTADTKVPGTAILYSELWRIAVTGGQPEKLGLVADSIIQPAVAPDGRYLAFSVNADITTSVHVLDHFLSPIELRRAAASESRR